jgi:hypothetical protein
MPNQSYHTDAAFKLSTGRNCNRHEKYGTKSLKRRDNVYDNTSPLRIEVSDVDALCHSIECTQGKVGIVIIDTLSRAMAGKEVIE